MTLRTRESFMGTTNELVGQLYHIRNSLMILKETPWYHKTEGDLFILAEGENFILGKSFGMENPLPWSPPNTPKTRSWPRCNGSSFAEAEQVTSLQTNYNCWRQWKNIYNPSTYLEELFSVSGLGVLSHYCCWVTATALWHGLTQVTGANYWPRWHWYSDRSP